jgi:hypothetical protein
MEYSKHDMKAKADRDARNYAAKEAEPMNDVPNGSATERALDELTAKREQLTGMLHILFDRLDPVLHPESNSLSKESPATPRPLGCQVVSRITCESDMIQSLCVQLDVILSRMEV